MNQTPSKLVQDRMAKGQAWLIAANDRLLSLTDAEYAQFTRALDLWDELESELRAGGFQGCAMPDGRCSEDAPVICQACASGASIWATR